MFFFVRKCIKIYLPEKSITVFARRTRVFPKGCYLWTWQATEKSFPHILKITSSFTDLNSLRTTLRCWNNCVLIVERWLCQRARQCDIRRHGGHRWTGGGRGRTVSDPAGLRPPRLPGLASTRENPVPYHSSYETPCKTYLLKLTLSTTQIELSQIR